MHWDDKNLMTTQADTLADEAVALYATPSYLVIEFRAIRKMYSLLTGIPHEERT